MLYDINKPYVLVFGASIVDITGFCAVEYIPFNSNPGRVRISYGGVCRNIAENLSRVGINTKFISIVGDDETGRGMLDYSRRIGYCMDDSLILKKNGTPTYMVILDHEGEMISAVVDMKGIEEADEAFVDSKASHFKHAAYTFVDADNPKLLAHMLQQFGKETRFVLDPVSAAKAANVKHLIGAFYAIKPNIHEAEILVGFGIKNDEDLIRAAEALHNKGVVHIFISLGAEGIFYSNGSEMGKIKAKDVRAINVTGGGDAFVAGIGYGYMNDMPFQEMVKYAIAMSVIAVTHAETINPEMCGDCVANHMKTIEWESVDLSK